MSKYDNIVPEDISSNEFDFHRASIEITSDTLYGSYEPYMFFLEIDNFPSTANIPPPLCRNQIKQSTHNRSF